MLVAMATTPLPGAQAICWTNKRSVFILNWFFSLIELNTFQCIFKKISPKHNSPGLGVSGCVPPRWSSVPLNPQLWSGLRSANLGSQSVTPAPCSQRWGCPAAEANAPQTLSWKPFFAG